MSANIVTAGGLMLTGSSSTLPVQALVGSASNRLELIEMSIINTTATACVWGLWKISTAGTPGAALTPAAHDVNDVTTGTLRGTYSGSVPTLGVDMGYRFSIPATIGAGIIRPFTPVGLVIPATQYAGIGLFPIGTPQLCYTDWTWLEV